MHPKNLSLESLGWTAALASQFEPFQARGLRPGRVVVEDKHHFLVFGHEGLLRGQCSGKILHQAQDSAALPKVGDWVAMAPLVAEEKCVIHHVLPRSNQLSRKVPGRKTSEQILVTNVSRAFVVQALDMTFNPRLLERFLLMVREGGIQPVVVLNKADLATDLEGWQRETQRVAGDAQILVVSAHTGKGMKHLVPLVQPQETVVFIGISGVGKSSIINALYGNDVAATMEVRESDSKGRHTTTWRELIVMPNGGLVIDTPGMREFQLWMGGDGIHETFPDIEALASQCRFTDCSHIKEISCAVLAARQAGLLPEERYQSFLKLSRELHYLAKVSHLKPARREKPWKHIAN